MSYEFADGYKIRDQYGLYFMTFTTVVPITIGRIDLFSTKIYRDIFIHENPVRAGWVEKRGHYLYSSASNYIMGKGIMKIDSLF